MRRTILGMAITAFALATSQAAIAETTMQTLLDRIQIEEVVQNYYAQLGRPKTKSFGESYTEDAEMILGTRVIKGRAAIEAMYRELAASSGNKPRPPMTLLLSNPRITVTGDTAHGEFIYTGIVAVAPDKAPVLHEQGREIDEFVKINGAWKIKRRQIIGEANAGMGAG